MILILAQTLGLFNQISPDTVNILIQNGEVKQTKGESPIQYIKLNENYDINSIINQD